MIAAAPPGGSGSGTRLDTLYYDLELHDDGFAEKVAQNAAAVNALGGGAGRAAAPLGSMDGALRSAAAEALKSADAFKAIAEGADTTGTDVAKLAADVQRLAVQLQQALAKVGGARPNTSGIDAVTARIRLLAQGATEVGTRAESLKRLEGAEAALQKTLARGNLSLQERIRVQIALRDAQNASAVPKLLQQEEQLRAKLAAENLTLKERITLTRQLLEVERQRQAAQQGTGAETANAAAALGALKGGLAAIGISVSARQLLQFLGDATTKARDFQAAMARVNTAAKQTESGLTGMAGGVDRLFRELPVNDIKELTDGLYDIVSAGIPAAQALDFLDTSARAAIGGATDVHTAVDGLTSVVNAYRDAGLTVKTASDQIFAAAAAGKTTFEELSHSMGLVIGTASSVGVSLDEVLAVTAQLTNSGVSTSQAMTGLQAAIQNILRPATEFQQQFPQLAAHFDEGRLRGEGFVQFLIDFQRESGGSSAALKTLFRDTEAYRTVVKLLADNGHGLVAMQQQIAGSTGEAAKAFHTMDETADAANKRLHNDLSLTLRGLGDAILPATNKGLETLVGLLHLLSGPSDKSRLDDVRTSLNGLVDLEQKLATSPLPDFINAQRVRQQTDEVGRAVKAAVDANKNALASLTDEELRSLERALNTANALGSHGAGGGADLASPIRAALDAEIARRRDLARATADQAAVARHANEQAVEDAAKAGDEIAKNVLAYRGEADAAAAAGRSAAAARGAITAAQEKLTQALADAKRAEQTGDAAAGDAAKRAAEGARATIEAQGQVLHDAQNTLAAKAKEIGTAMRAATAGVGDAIASTTKTGVDNALVALQRYEEEVARLKRENPAGDFAALDAEIARQRASVGVLETQERDAAQRRVAGILAGAAGSQVATLRFALEDLLKDIDQTNAEYAKLGKAPLVTPQQRQQVVEIQEGFIKVTDSVERANAVLDHFDGLRSRGEKVGFFTEFRAVDAEVARLNAELDKLPEVDAQGKRITENEARRKTILAEIARLMARIKEIQDDTENANEKAREREAQHRQDVLQKIQAYGSLANSVVELANAFGLVNSQAAQALNSIVGVGEGIARIASGDVIGGVTQTLSSVAGLLNAVTGTSPEEQERRRVMEANTAALHALADHLGDLVGTSGSTIAAGQAFAANLPGFLARFGPLGRGDAAKLTVSDAMLRSDLGISQKQLEDLAQTLGITLDGTVGSFRKLAEAIQQADLAAFVDSFDGALSRLQASFDIYNVTDPGEKLARTIATLTDPKTGIPALAFLTQPGTPITRTVGFGPLAHTVTVPGLATPLALDTPEARAAAIKQLQDLFEQISKGAITAAQLGGASPSEVIDAIKDLIDQLRGLDQTGTATQSGTGGFNTDRTITEVTASRIGGLLTSGNAILAEIAAATRASADVLVGGALPDDLVSALKASAPTPLSADAVAALLGGIGVGSGAILPPSAPFPATAGTGSASAGVTVSIAAGAFPVAVSVTLQTGGAHVSTQEAQTIGEKIGDAIVAEVDARLQRNLLFKRLAAGDTAL